MKYFKVNASLNMVYQKNRNVYYFFAGGEFCASLFIYI